MPDYDAAILYDDLETTYDGAVEGDVVASAVSAVDLTGRSRRVDTFGWDVLDRALNLIGTLTPEVGASLSVSTSGPGRVVRGVTLTAADSAAINPTADRLRPYYVDNLGVVYPLGVYRVASSATDDRAQVVAYDLVDESIRFASTINRAQTWPRDYPVVLALAEWAEAIDAATVEIDPTVETLGEPVAFPVGEATWGEVGQALCEAGGMLPPHFRNTGALRCRLSPSWAEVTADHYYSLEDDRVVAGGYTTADVYLDLPNVWYAISDNPSNASVAGRWAVPASAPHSVERIGYEVPEVITGPYRTPAVAESAAENAGRTAFAQVGEVGLDTVFDPRHDLYGIVDLDGFRWREVQWSVDLRAGGVQRHDLRRVW